jgi:flavin-binding protein dodecin
VAFFICAQVREAGRDVRVRKPAGVESRRYNAEELVTQKVIEVVGTSNQSFAKAAESAVKEAAKTVRGIKWAHIESLDILLEGAKVTQYRATTKIYFDVEQ